MANYRRETLYETLKRDNQSMLDCDDLYTIYMYKLLRYQDLLSSGVCSPGFRKNLLARMNTYAETWAKITIGN